MHVMHVLAALANQHEAHEFDTQYACLALLQLHSLCQQAHVSDASAVSEKKQF